MKNLKRSDLNKQSFALFVIMKPQDIRNKVYDIFEEIKFVESCKRHQNKIMKRETSYYSICDRIEQNRLFTINTCLGNIKNFDDKITSLVMKIEELF